MTAALWHLYNRQLDTWLIWGWIWSPVWVPAVWTAIAVRAIWIWRQGARK